MIFAQRGAVLRGEVEGPDSVEAKKAQNRAEQTQIMVNVCISKGFPHYPPAHSTGHEFEKWLFRVSDRVKG